jgi:hypothetical protein
LALTALALPAFSSAQVPIAGDWQGTLNAGSTQLHLLLHLAAAKDGSLSATLDSIDQGVDDIPVNAVTLKDSKLNLTVDAVHGSYEGTVNKDASEIDGIWSQGQPLELKFTRAPAQTAAPKPAAPKPGPPSEIDGTWQGMLDAGTAKLRILFKIVNTQDGLTAQMQSPDQATMWIAASSVTRNASALTIALKGIGITFDGKISADLSSIDGTLTQMGQVLPLTVKRAAEPAK